MKCKVDGCDNASRAVGFCSNHYRIHRREINGPIVNVEKVERQRRPDVLYCMTCGLVRDWGCPTHVPQWHSVL